MPRVFSNKFSTRPQTNSYYHNKKINSIEGYLSFMDYSQHPFFTNIAPDQNHRHHHPHHHHHHRHNHDHIHMEKLYPYGSLIVVPTVMSSIVSRPVLLMLSKNPDHNHHYNHHHNHNSYPSHDNYNHNPQYSSLFI